MNGAVESFPVLAAFECRLRCWAGSVKSPAWPQSSCPCPLICTQNSGMCRAMVCPLIISSTNEIFLQISFLRAVPFHICAEQQSVISRPEEFQQFLSLWACLCPCPTGLCCSWRQITVSPKTMVAFNCHWNGVFSLYSACLELKDTDEQQNLCANSKHT